MSAADPSNWDIKWVDAGREPKVKPDPHYPDGKDVNVVCGARRSCTVALPYPAKRCGAYHAVCKVCGYAAIVTTAGRSDDPRSLTVPCRPDKRAH